MHAVLLKLFPRLDGPPTQGLASFLALDTTAAMASRLIQCDVRFRASASCRTRPLSRRRVDGCRLCHGASVAKGDTSHYHMVADWRLSMPLKDRCTAGSQPQHRRGCPSARSRVRRRRARSCATGAAPRARISKPSAVARVTPGKRVRDAGLEGPQLGLRHVEIAQQLGGVMRNSHISISIMRERNGPAP